MVLARVQTAGDCQLSEELGAGLYEDGAVLWCMLSIDQAVAEVLSIRYEDLVG